MADLIDIGKNKRVVCALVAFYKTVEWPTGGTGGTYLPTPIPHPMSGQVPQAKHPIVAPRHEQPAVRREGQCANGTGMPFQCSKVCAALHAPQLQCANACAAGNSKASVRAAHKSPHASTTMTFLSLGHAGRVPGLSVCLLLLTYWYYWPS